MFEIIETSDGVLEFHGRLDASQSDEALRRLNAVSQPVTADFDRLEYVSSAGIGVILSTYKRLADAGHRFRIINVSPRIATVFRYAGLDTLLEIETRPE